MEAEPGVEVMLTGLKAHPELNGKMGVVQPRDCWPTNGRVGVLLHDPSVEQRSIAVKLCNLEVRTKACFICLEGGVAGKNELIPTGCGCRGTSGFVHRACAISAAAAHQERTGAWAGRTGMPWQVCATCKVPYTGVLKLELAREWCRRTADQSSDGVERFAARTTLGNALSASGQLAEAEEVVRANLEAATLLHGAEHRHTLGTTMNLGLVLSSRGKTAEAEALYKQLLEAQRRVLGPEHRDTLSTVVQLAGAALAQGHNTEAEQQYRELISVQRQLGMPDDHATALICAMNLGSALLNQARFGEAAEVYQANLRLKRQKLGPEHPDTLMVAMNLASVRKERGEFDEAQRLLLENLATKQRVLGPQHLDTSYAAINLVATWTDGRYADKYVEAERLAAKTLATLRHGLGAEHPTSLSAAMYHAAALQRSDAPQCAAQARELMQAVHRSQEKVHGDAHPDVLETAWRLSALIVSEPETDHDGLQSAAQSLHQTALAQRRAYGTAHHELEHPRTARTMVSLAEALVKLDPVRYASQALKICDRCEAAQRAVLSPAHPELLQNQALKAKCTSYVTPESAGAPFDGKPNPDAPPQHDDEQGLTWLADLLGSSCGLQDQEQVDCRAP